MTSLRESHNELIGLGRRLREAIPDVYAGYAQLHNASMGATVSVLLARKPPALDRPQSSRGSRSRRRDPRPNRHRSVYSGCAN